jgi:hypothetical protein
MVSLRDFDSIIGNRLPLAYSSHIGCPAIKFARCSLGRYVFPHLGPASLTRPQDINTTWFVAPVVLCDCFAMACSGALLASPPPQGGSSGAPQSVAWHAACWFHGGDALALGTTLGAVAIVGRPAFITNQPTVAMSVGPSALRALVGAGTTAAAVVTRPAWLPVDFDEYGCASFLVVSCCYILCDSVCSGLVCGGMWGCS